MAPTKSLFDPIQVGKVVLKNRVVMLGVTTGFAEKYEVTDRLIDFFAARAAGGAGLITLGSVYPADFASTSPGYLAIGLGTGIWDDRFIPGLRRLNEALHENGAKTACQLTLCSEWRRGRDVRLEGVGPSEGRGGPGVKAVRALTVEEIHIIEDQFAEGARRARQAGFDMVEFHAGIGYLINRFLSPYSNKRTDEYGGSLENRMRFLLEIIELSQRKTGSDYTYTCRVSGDEFLEGGNTLEDMKKIVPALAKAGIAAFNVQAGWHESPRPLVQQWVPSAAFVYLARELKRVTDVPVIAAYRIDNPSLAMKIVATGQADMVGMARALIADADFPNKTRLGKLADIRPCIACCRCLDDTFSGVPITCSVNPDLSGKRISPAAKSKRVLVVGGGPAGTEAARVAALRGHRVTLCEQGPRLGGLLVLAAVLNDKLEPFVRWMRGQVGSLPVKVKTELTNALLKELSPDVVIIAPGGTLVGPAIPGIQGPNVITSLDIKGLLGGFPPRPGFLWKVGALVARPLAQRPFVLRKLLALNFPIQQKVAIIGAQFPGCELALMLSEKGKKVTMLDESRRAASDIGPVSRWLVLDMLEKRGVDIVTGVKITEVTTKGIKIKGNSAERLVEADTVLIALGVTENTSLAPQLANNSADVYLVGDAAQGTGIRRLREAISSAFEVASKV